MIRKYNFQFTKEPSEKQLMLIMREVAEEAKQKAAVTEKKFNEYLNLLIIDTINEFNAKYGISK